MLSPQVLADVDAYKLSHKGFLPDDLEYQYSNGTARSAKYLPVIKEYYDNKAVMFSMQRLIKDYLIREWNEHFFQRPKGDVIGRFRRRCDTFLGPDSVSMDHFAGLHDLGYLPLSIKTILEGNRVNLRVPFYTTVNTHPSFAWLTNYLETVMSCEIWKPMTVATIAFEIRRMMSTYALKTTGSADFPFNAHGFEFRGMSGRHDAGISGCGHLLSFRGTDTMRCIDILEESYGANSETELIAASVPASEHMVSSLGIALRDELSFYRWAITERYPTGIVSLVADTLDFFRVVTEYARALKDDILARKVNAIGLAKVVFRPDSGNPVHIVCGDPAAPDDSPERKGAVECLWEVFGGTVTKQGYRVLHERCGLIYGDSCNPQIINEILKGLEAKGFATTNCVFGVGSFTYNYLTRDCLGFAIKGTWAQVGGRPYNLFKTPKTDSGLKNSARGLLRVDKVGHDYVLREAVTPEEEKGGELIETFRDGKLLVDQSLGEIRGRIDAEIKRVVGA